MKTNIAQHWGKYLLLLAAFLSVGIYLYASSRTEGIGFPLDDAWIHQTYARGLSSSGQFAFIPGERSGGSTAPLWSGLLAVGYALKIPYLFWTHLLGIFSLFCMALAGEALFRRLLGGLRAGLPWAGLFLVTEWHMTWAAASGMETILASLMPLLVLWTSASVRGIRWLFVGMLIGASMWIRPDSLALLGPAGLLLIVSESGWKVRLRSLLFLVLGFVLLFGPYMLFNWLVEGSIWPNTFYAKQAEYAVMREQSLFTRMMKEYSMPLIGGGLLLLPGFVSLLVRSVRERRWLVLAGSAWFLGYIMLYALRLPVTYQYGRYVMPSMPVYFVIGLAGTALLVRSLRRSRAGWLLARVWLLSLSGLWTAFFFVGAGRYAQDVAIVETEMVASARWIADNTPASALVAAHDIGAVGYFGGRRLVDLAGLVSPEVIPFIRDEDRIAAWLDEAQVEYLVIFQGWYQYLPEGRELLFETDSPYTARAGGSPMQVYRWKR